MNRLIRILLGLALVSGGLATAQTAPPTEACSQAVDASGMTGCEQAVLENLNLKNQLLQTQESLLKTQAQTVQDSFNSTLQIIMKKHSGMTYNPPSQNFPLGNFVPTPTPSKGAPATVPAKPAK